jgi:hypothetical protein
MFLLVYSRSEISVHGHEMVCVYSGLKCVFSEVKAKYY